MTDIFLRELLYICTLSSDEFPEYICSLPFTYVESIIEKTLNEEEGFMFDLLTAKITILKSNIKGNNEKKALKKLHRACTTLGVLGYFDFGDWELFRGDIVIDKNKEPIKLIKDLQEAGQLKMDPVDGKYVPYVTMPQFIQWCFDNGYKDDLSPDFILDNIYYNGNGGDKRRSIKEYMGKAKREQ